MRTSALFNLVLLFFATNVTAQRNNQNQSSLFSLVLKSRNSSISGSVLGPCHIGAATEALCLTKTTDLPANYSTAFFHFNTTGDDIDTVPSPGAVGVLSYALPLVSGPLTSPMVLAIDPTSNVAVPQLTPSILDTTGVAFDSDGKMNIQGSIDDTVYPQVYKTIPYYRWYACYTNDIGYTYQTLAWVIGPREPENPTCIKVDVVRVFPSH